VADFYRQSGRIFPCRWQDANGICRHNWALRGYGCLEDELKHYSPFWKNKIEKNVERDMNVNEHYKGEGWTVIRIWESEINTNLKESADTVEYAYRNAMRNK
jgi:DNA mismatch endonuclease (patch repair protein)